MASAEQLIQEAYFAFQNVSPGATDENRQRSRAKKYAMRVLKQYPVSVEAEQARTILDGLKIKVDDAPARFVTTHTHDARSEKLVKPSGKPGREPAETEWKALWQQFSRLPYLQKRILMFVLMFIVLIAVFTPFLWVFAFLVLVKRTAVKQLLQKVLLSMDPEAPRNG